MVPREQVSFMSLLLLFDGTSFGSHAVDLCKKSVKIMDLF